MDSSPRRLHVVPRRTHVAPIGPSWSPPRTPPGWSRGGSTKSAADSDGLRRTPRESDAAPTESCGLSKSTSGGLESTSPPKWKSTADSKVRRGLFQQSPPRLHRGLFRWSLWTPPWSPPRSPPWTNFRWSSWTPPRT